MTLTDAPTDTAMRRIGSLVRDARRHHGLTQQQLAERLGTSQSAVARIEQGNQNLTLELVGHPAAEPPRRSGHENVHGPQSGRTGPSRRCGHSGISHTRYRDRS